MTVRLLADENIARSVVLGLRRVVDGVDIVRIQDVGLRTADDPAILQWAADEGRVLVSHDRRTIPGFASDRVKAGLRMPGVILPRASMPVAAIIEDLSLIVTATEAADWENQIGYLPLQ